MTTATAALTDDGDGPIDWLPRAARELPAQWVRIALPLLPFALLMMWLMHSLFAALKNMFASLSASGAPADPGTPLAFQIAEQLDKTPVQMVMFTICAGLWMLWASTRATGHATRLLPGSPLNLYGRSIAVVAPLVVATSIVLGPLFSRVLGGTVDGLGGVAASGLAEQAGAEATSTGIVFLLGALLAAFIGAAALPWVALFGDDMPTPAPDAAAAVPGPAQAAVAATAATGGEQTAPAAQVVDAQYVAQPGASVGAWWQLPAGATVYIETAASGDVAAQPAVSDVSQAWCQTQPGQSPASATFTAPSEGWYMLGAYLPSQAPQHVHVRLTLPPGAQAAPDSGAA